MSAVLLELGDEADGHAHEVEEVKRRVGIAHEHFDCWIFNFLQNKNFNVDETVAKLERRAAMERNELANIEITNYMRENMKSGIIQLIGEDRRGNITFYVVTSRDSPSKEVREARMKIFDMWLMYGSRLRKGNKRCRVTLLVNQKDASLWSNLDMTFQYNVALRVAKYYPGAFDKAFICCTGRAATAFAKPIIARMPSEISEKVFLFNEKSVLEGCMLEHFDENVLPVALGGKNACDAPASYAHFYDEVSSYFERAREGLRQGYSLKEWELAQLEGEPPTAASPLSLSPVTPQPSRESDRFLERRATMWNDTPRHVLLSPCVGRAISFAEALAMCSNDNVAPLRPTSAEGSQDGGADTRADGVDASAANEMPRVSGPDLEEDRGPPLSWRRTPSRDARALRALCALEAYNRGVEGFRHKTAHLRPTASDVDALRCVLEHAVSIAAGIGAALPPGDTERAVDEMRALSGELQQRAARSEAAAAATADELEARRRHCVLVHPRDDLGNRERISRLESDMEQLLQEAECARAGVELLVRGNRGPPTPLPRDFSTFGQFAGGACHVLRAVHRASSTLARHLAQVLLQQLMQPEPGPPALANELTALHRVQHAVQAAAAQLDEPHPNHFRMNPATGLGSCSGSILSTLRMMPAMAPAVSGPGAPGVEIEARLATFAERSRERRVRSTLRMLSFPGIRVRLGHFLPPHTVMLHHDVAAKALNFSECDHAPPVLLLTISACDIGCVCEGGMRGSCEVHLRAACEPVVFSSSDAVDDDVLVHALQHIVWNESDPAMLRPLPEILCRSTQGRLNSL